MTPANDQAAVFAQTGHLISHSTERALASIVRYLDDNNYTVQQYFDGNLPDFIRMARDRVIVFETHGTADGALAVQAEPTEAAMERVYAGYLHHGYRSSWLDEGSLDGTQIRSADRGPWVIGLTSTGITHFFGTRHIAVVLALACDSISAARSFHALSYFGYLNPVRCNTSVGDAVNIVGRLAGIDGVDNRTTTAAFADLHATDGLDLVGAGGNGSAPQPVVLSPAVLSTDPSTSTVVAGQSVGGSVQFDAAMDTAKTTGMVTASGCGATVTNVQWASDDPTTLNFTINVPQSAAAGTITLTVSNALAVGNPGGLPNDALDGNQPPSPGNGEAPNGTDYVWQVPCAPAPNACDLMSVAEATSVMGNGDASEAGANPNPDGTETCNWYPTIRTVQPYTDPSFIIVSLTYYTDQPSGYLDGATAQAALENDNECSSPQHVSGVGDDAYYCSGTSGAELDAQKGGVLIEIQWTPNGGYGLSPPAESTLASIVTTAFPMLGA